MEPDNETRMFGHNHCSSVKSLAELEGFEPGLVTFPSQTMNENRRQYSRSILQWVNAHDQCDYNK